MTRRTLALAATLSGLMLAAAANASGSDETRIRQDGQNLKIVGTPGNLVFWTMTGYSNSLILTPFCTATIAQICANPSAYGVIEVVNHSGGQTSLRFCKTMKSAWLGQTACVVTNGQVIDGDKFAAN